MRLRMDTVVPFPGADFTVSRSIKLSMMVKPMPLRSWPPVVNSGCRAWRMSSIPRPQSRTVSSSTPPSKMRSFITIFPSSSG